jgi:hypothetical protein
MPSCILAGPCDFSGFSQSLQAYSNTVSICGTSFLSTEWFASESSTRPTLYDHKHTHFSQLISRYFFTIFSIFGGGFFSTFVIFGFFKITSRNVGGMCNLFLRRPNLTQTNPTQYEYNTIINRLTQHLYITNPQSDTCFGYLKAASGWRYKQKMYSTKRNIIINTWDLNFCHIRYVYIL